MTAGASIVAHGVTKRYRSGTAERTALDDVSFVVEPGSAVAVVGPSGAGKSTLLHLVGAMDTIDSGSITVDDTRVESLDERGRTTYRRSVGFIFQRFHLLPALTVLDNVVAPVLPRTVDFDKEARGRELLGAVGLLGRERSLASRLSGGEQQRVAIARALINQPPLILADEPTGNLDTKNGTAILELLLQIRADTGATVLIVTHNPSIAARCDLVLRLDDGRITEYLAVKAERELDETLARISRVDL